MQVSCPNGSIKIYNLSHGKTLPDFLTDRKKRALLKKDTELRERINLIQDFSMPTVSTKVKTTPDGHYIYAAGTYKPRIKCFDTKELSLKFERYLDAEVVDFISLSDDYAKLAIMMDNRKIEFHTQQGKHYSFRIPIFGREMCYNDFNCDLMLAGAGKEIYRFNLEQGQFLKSYETTLQEVKSCEVSPLHHLLMCGGNNGIIECWDPRSRHRVTMMNIETGLIPHVLDFKGCDVTKVKYHKEIELAVGTSTGQVMMYDLRNNKPFMVKDHRYGEAIHSIDYNKENEVMVSADSRSVKIWSLEGGETKTFMEVEDENEINHMHVVKDSGLIFLANESERILTYFLPWLGRAPKWCDRLDHLVEGTEEQTTEVFDDYKFLDAAEIERLGMKDLVGTEYLRAEANGYYVKLKLYQQYASYEKVDLFEKYRQQTLDAVKRKAREEKGAAAQKTTVKVNRDFAQKLQEVAANDEAVKGKKKLEQDRAKNLLSGNNRFSMVFEDADFAIDTESEQYKLINPASLKAKAAKKRKLDDSSDEEDAAAAGSEDEVESGAGDVDSTSSEDSSDDETREKWVNDYKSSKDTSANRLELRREGDAATSLREPRMFKLREGLQVGSEDKVNLTSKASLEKYGGQSAAVKRRRQQKASMLDRVKEMEASGKNLIDQNARSVRGAKESTFYLKKTDKDTKKKDDDKVHMRERKKLRRNADKLMKDKS